MPAPPPEAPPPAEPAEAKKVGPPPLEGDLATVMALISAGKRDDALAKALAWRDRDAGDVLALVALGEALEAKQMPALAARASVPSSTVRRAPTSAASRRAPRAARRRRAPRPATPPLPGMRAAGSPHRPSLAGVVAGAVAICRVRSPRSSAA
jgi:hypothetical protein